MELIARSKNYDVVSFFSAAAGWCSPAGVGVVVVG